jgi:hypothetical protein
MRRLIQNGVALGNWIQLFNPDWPAEEPQFNKSALDISSAWYYASLHGLTNLIDMLRPDYDVDAQAGFNRNALQAASFGGFSDTVEHLIRLSANVRARPSADPKTALQVAAYRGHDKVVTLLLNEGADVNSFGRFFGYALQAAAYECHEDTVRILLEAGAEVNARRGRWDSALTAASWSGGVGTVNLLLESGADINYMSATVTTALQVASCDGREQIVEALLARDADPNLVATAEQWFGTALCAAAAAGFLNIAKRLVAKGAGVNLGGGKYGTPLIAAVVEGRVGMVEWLLDNCADPSIEGKDGNNAWGALETSAHREHCCEIEQLLRVFHTPLTST